jgi:dUTP pyrophosphatase
MLNRLELLEKDLPMDEKNILTFDGDGDVTGISESLIDKITFVTPIFRFAIRQELQYYTSFLPSKTHSDDTGWDVRAAQDITLRAGQYAKIPLGFRTFAPKGWWLEIRPRSSSFVKRHLHCLYGVIDEGFENEMIFACQYIPDVSAMGQDLHIKFGEAIGQILPIKRQEMVVQQISNEEYDQLAATRAGSRGTGGFGSTDHQKVEK